MTPGGPLCGPFATQGCSHRICTSSAMVRSLWERPCVAKGLQSSPDNPSVYPARRTNPHASNPTSNSTHIGTASRVWENTSGGVRIIPTTKQPTIT